MPWINAAWRNALRPDVGDHLGQVYEAMGKKEEALATYRLAEASIENGNVTSDTRKHLTESIARLTPASAKPARKWERHSCRSRGVIRSRVLRV